MENSSTEPKSVKNHVVVMPFPGRGHVNPMMNFCKLIIAQSQPRTTVITFIVTEEWLGFLSSEPKPPPNIRLATIPNVIPSEIGRAKDWPGFIRAAFTNLEAPVEQLLDRLDELLLPKPNVIIYDTYLKWMVGVGNRRNIPVASFWTQSATLFSIFHHFNLVLEKGHFNSNLKEKGNEMIDYIPGAPALRVADLPTALTGKGQEVLFDCLEGISLVSKAQYLLFTSTYELEAGVIDALGKEFAFPIYSIGPAIPTIGLSETESSTSSTPEYVKWLDAQPEKSVLYISQGSFLSVSKAQLDEIVAGVHESGVQFLWVTRDDVNSSGRSGESGESNGIVVPWCDQLKVLSHPSIGGFWSHCGWNSTKEAIFSGIPVLVFPIFWDQTTNAKQIVDDWKTGWRVKKYEENLIPRAEIAELVRKFMDLESDEGNEIRKRAKELQTICQQALKLGGSSRNAVEAFLTDISCSKR
ncbi:OLC1v1006338C1 [Oldenlandia corymbosa var. corymbosa]|uniref:OLC1v1006338C1 n=1 Tax=Oldenlandia corymbosa var. corymbosa TaxID=529605 RepID=A0AAV1DH93_OLDCO|nr:OLC1v1006338C1 [Oldenlandia corymbosa var. corymbosa]